MFRLGTKLRRRIVGDPTRLVVVPPKPRQDREGLAVVLIARNEERHIMDWLRYYSLAGAQAAIIYDNGSDDETARLADEFSGLTTHVIPWVTDIFLGSTPLKRQPMAYAHAICTFGARYRWMTFVDIDEYIVPVEARSIPEALDDLSAFSNISLPWTMFGTSGHVSEPEIPAVYAYEQRARDRRPSFTNYKCIVDPCDVTSVSTHKYLTRSMGAQSVNDEGAFAKDHKARRSEVFATSSRLQLNHYYTFSQEEFARKLSRETVSHQDAAARRDTVTSMKAMIEEDTVADMTAKRFLERRGYTDWRLFRKLA